MFGIKIAFAEVEIWPPKCAWVVLKCPSDAQIIKDKEDSKDKKYKSKTSKAEVLHIFDEDGNDIKTAYTLDLGSKGHNYFIYSCGDIIEPTRPFDEQLCGSGIHFCDIGDNLDKWVKKDCAGYYKALEELKMKVKNYVQR